MQPPQSIEEIKAGLETTEKGGVRQSIRNCLTVFQRDPLLSGAIAYNILTDRKDIIKPIGFHRESTALNDTDMKYLLLYLEISLFAGLIKCGECGKSLTIRYTNAKHPQQIYSCKTYNAFGKNHCTQHRIDYDTLSCCVNSCFFLVINPPVQYETKWVSERSVWMLRSDALLRYSFFYSGDNDYRNSSVSFCNAAPLLISDFFSAPLAKQKETRYNMTERTKSVIFKEARAWLLPITRLSSSARRC